MFFLSDLQAKPLQPQPQWLSTAKKLTFRRHKKSTEADDVVTHNENHHSAEILEEKIGRFQLPSNSVGPGHSDIRVVGNIAIKFEYAVP